MTGHAAGPDTDLSLGEPWALERFPTAIEVGAKAQAGVEPRIIDGIEASRDGGAG